MPIIVELEPASADALHAAVGAASTVVAGLEMLRRELEEKPNEYAIILGPSVDLSASLPAPPVSMSGAITN